MTRTFFQSDALRVVNDGRRVLRLLLLLAASPLVAGCGYVSTSAYLDHIKSIYIPKVINQTLEPKIEDELSGELDTRFKTKWRDNGEDSTLRMTVHEYTIKPVRYGVNNEPEQYRMAIVLDYEFRDNVKQKLIDSKRDYEYHRDFWVVSGRGEPPEDEEMARKTLIRDMVDTLYNNLAEQW